MLEVKNFASKQTSKLKYFFFLFVTTKISWNQIWFNIFIFSPLDEERRTEHEAEFYDGDKDQDGDTMPLPPISKTNGVSSSGGGDRAGGATSLLTEKTDGNHASGGGNGSGSNEGAGGGGGAINERKWYELKVVLRKVFWADLLYFQIRKK